ncbi:WD40-repeat-containing domain protein [Suillus tomentosus]|nr:WD40-repeat-containing domain protein [Suillus tomentosus]
MESDSAFVAPEGVYSVTEEHKPLPVPIHSSTAAQPIYQTRLSSVTVRFPPKHSVSPGLAQFLGANLTKDLKKDKEKEREKEKEAVVKERPLLEERSMSSGSTPEDSFSSPDVVATPDLSAEPQQYKLFSHPSVSVGKKKSNISRPKHNMRTTSSTFITRLQSTEGLSKTLAAKQGDVTFLFYNTGKAFLWIEVGSKTKVRHLALGREPLTRISFSAYPTCHDVNPSTASSERLDVIIGFSTGDLVWFDPISSRYCRLNKQGTISASLCTAVRWVPSSPTLFLVSHADGTIIVYDKEREDGIFTATIPNGLTNTPHITINAHHASPVSDEWDPLSTIFVTPPPWHPEAIGKGEKGVVVKNPVSHWRLCRRGVVDFVFSPDNKYVAAISDDGCLRVIDPLAEQLVDCYASYFGSMTCVAWSPDGRFILTGGQDDLLTIFSPWEQRVVARCQGHSSFVSAVAFDELRCDGRTYRFGSVGEDNKLILWDFSSGALHRPKLLGAHHPRPSVSSSISLAHRRGTGSTIQLSAPRYHPAPSRNEVSTVQPVLVKQLDADLLTSLAFLPRALITASKAGHVRVWVRPLVMANPSPRRRHTRGTLSVTDFRGVVH